MGVRVEDVDYVMCTHLHVDHVGWNTRLEDGHWAPTFPNARYVFSTRELQFWTDRERNDPQAFPWITDSVLPVVAANCAQLVTSDCALNDLVTLMPTPGHTIDHYSVRIGRRAEAAIVAGDLVHSPLQVRYPDLGMFADSIPIGRRRPGSAFSRASVNRTRCFVRDTSRASPSDASFALRTNSSSYPV